MLRGTKNLNHQQIQDALDKNFARLGGGRAAWAAGEMGGGGGGSVGTLSYSIETKRANLPAVLEILRQVLREPTLPESEFEVMKNERLAGLEQGRSDPMRQGINHLQRLLSQYPDRLTSGTCRPIDEEIQRIKEVTVEDVRSLYDDYLGASHGELTIVGDFEPSEALSVLSRTFEGWKNPQPYARIERPFQPGLKPTRETILTPDKANASYFAGLTVEMKDSDPDYPALVIGNYILGGGAISSRIADRLRQKGGLSYSAAVELLGQPARSPGQPADHGHLQSGQPRQGGLRRR